MPSGDRERLLGRIRQIRRTTADREQHESEAPGPSEDPIGALEARVSHLEHLLEGLQDSVHREFERQDELISRLQNEIEPAALSAALAEHARNRGL